MYYFASSVLYIFLKQPCMNIWYVVVNCALFWFWGYARETSLDQSKTWVDNIRFSTFILCIKKWLIINNYRTAHWHIRPQSDDEQGINKLRSKLSSLFTWSGIPTVQITRMFSLTGFIHWLVKFPWGFVYFFPLFQEQGNEVDVFSTAWSFSKMYCLALTVQQPHGNTDPLDQFYSHNLSE